MRRLLALASTALVAALALAATQASASSNLRVGITDDAWLEFGPGEIGERAARLRSLGAEVSRVTLDWRTIQPSREAYEWGRTDTLLGALRTAGIQPVIAIWGTPAWANGGHGPNVAPQSASTFATFARAAAQQYPWVRRWVVWNEPNQRRWLDPPSPIAYVTKLLNPAAAAIKSVIPGAAIAGGATAPRGSRGGTSPVDFIRAMGRAGATLDAYAHHPHSLSPAETPSTGGCARCTTITMATLERLLDETRKAFGTRTRIWLTELGYQTNPPDRILGVTWTRQARFNRRGAVPRVRRKPGRPPDPVPRTRRATYLGLAERSGDDDRAGEAGARRISAALRAGLAERRRDQGVGSGPHGHRCTPIRRPAEGRVGLAVVPHGRDDRSRALHGDGSGRGRHQAAALRSRHAQGKLGARRQVDAETSTTATSARATPASWTPRNRSRRRNVARNVVVTG